MPTYGYFIPYGHFPIQYILYGHFIPYGHFPLWTLFHMDILPYGQFADSPSRQAMILAYSLSKARLGFLVLDKGSDNINNKCIILP